MERVNQDMEDMLRACVLDFHGSREEHLPLGELVYNNSYHSTISTALYEALYGRPCRSLVCWAELKDDLFLGPDLEKETTKKVAVIWDHILAARVDRRVMWIKGEDP